MYQKFIFSICKNRYYSHNLLKIENTFNKKNYLHLQVLVSVQPSDSFEVVESNNASTVIQQTLDIPNMEGKTCLFPIRPKILGEILVTVKAISKGAASDIVTGKVIVKVNT